MYTISIHTALVLPPSDWCRNGKHCRPPAGLAAATSVVQWSDPVDPSQLWTVVSGSGQSGCIWESSGRRLGGFAPQFWRIHFQMWWSCLWRLLMEFDWLCTACWWDCFVCYLCVLVLEDSGLNVWHWSSSALYTNCILCWQFQICSLNVDMGAGLCIFTPLLSWHVTIVPPYNGNVFCWHFHVMDWADHVNSDIFHASLSQFSVQKIVKYVLMNKGFI